MNKIENDIDDLYKNRLSSGTAKHSDMLWGTLQKEYRVIKFLKFNIFSFNIYYVILGITISTGIWFYILHSKTPLLNAKPKQSIKKTILTTPSVHSKKIELPDNNRLQNSSDKNNLPVIAKPVLTENKKVDPNAKNKAGASINLIHDNQTETTSEVKKNVGESPLIQDENTLPNEQVIEIQKGKNKLKVDSVIKYDTTIISKKKVKFKWNKNK